MAATGTQGPVTPKLIPPNQPLAATPEVPPLAPVALAGAAAGTATPGGHEVEPPCQGAAGDGSLGPALLKRIPPPRPWASGQARWCDHLGLLLFWEELNQMMAVLTPPVPWLKQWLASVLLGAVNVEQTKYLNWDELSLLLGPVVAGPTLQRHALTELATQATVEAVWRWNVQHVGAFNERDFYLDPHTKHYTGQQPILKGWCPVIRWADKALHSDFVHSVRQETACF